MEGIEWIRLHYAYPSKFPLEVLDVMRERDNICKYIDIPLQHASNNMLKAMRRNITREEMTELITEIRKRVPGIAIRTTLITGFPGETLEDVEELKEFLQLQVLVDKKEAGRWLGRTEFDSVEVDNEVVINTNKRLKSGDMVMVKITKAYDYDLEGELVG